MRSILFCLTALGWCAQAAPTGRLNLNIPLGSASTPLGDSSAERTGNIALAASRIDGTILLPGDRFSFNEVVGRRTAEAGYLAAPTLVYGSREAVVGGGICQLATTVYNAALLSDLKMLERHRHATTVPYCPPGQDATVSWGSKDLAFQNSLAQPVRIQAGVEDGMVMVRFFGEQSLPDEIHLETEEWEIPSPFDAHPSSGGMEVTLYRVRSRDGEVVERQYLHRDVYPPRIVLRTQE